LGGTELRGGQCSDFQQERVVDLRKRYDEFSSIFSTHTALFSSVRDRMRVEEAERNPTDPPSALQTQLSEQLQDVEVTISCLVVTCKDFDQESTLIER
jgi:hypothetical protein